MVQAPALEADLKLFTVFIIDGIDIFTQPKPLNSASCCPPVKLICEHCIWAFLKNESPQYTPKDM